MNHGRLQQRQVTWHYLFYYFFLPLGLGVLHGPFTQLQAQVRYPVQTAEYKLPAVVDPDILSDRETEIWGKIYWPNRPIGMAAMPVVVFLHGNHSTCGRGSAPRIDDNSAYTSTGVCPAGYVPVPNHEGYGYVAAELASLGFFVISINANRGINAAGGVSGDSGLNLARGRLILKHLQMWQQWTLHTYGAGSQVPLPVTLSTDPQAFQHLLDFAHVGLVGHSRGGEGVRAAYELLNDQTSPWGSKLPGLDIKAIFEIAAVDGQTSRVLNAHHIPWHQLIPLCDGDVSNLIGIAPYHRMLQYTIPMGSAQKSVSLIYGANHNFFNTEWQQSDSRGCYMHTPLWDTVNQTGQGSAAQLAIAKHLITQFFTANLGPQSQRALNQLFNPMHSIPTVLSAITSIDRDFTPNPNLSMQTRVEDFTKAARIGAPSLSIVNTIVHSGSAPLNISYDNAFSSSIDFMKVQWDAPTTVDPFQTAKSDLILDMHQSIDVSHQISLDLRFSLLPKAALLNPIKISLQLVDITGQESLLVPLSDLTTILLNPFYSVLFQTIRIPLSQFLPLTAISLDLTQIKRIKFVINTDQASGFALANIRFSATDQTQATLPLVGIVAGISTSAKNHSAPQIVAVLNNQSAPKKVHVKINAAPSFVVASELNRIAGWKNEKLFLHSKVSFPVSNALPILILKRQFQTEIVDLSEFEPGPTNLIGFHFSKKLRQKVKGQQWKMMVGHRERPEQQWDFGTYQF